MGFETWADEYVESLRCSTFLGRTPRHRAHQRSGPMPVHSDDDVLPSRFVDANPYAWHRARLETSGATRIS